MISLNYKAQFQKNDLLAKAHRELVVTDAFQVAVEMALLQYQASLHSDITPNVSAADAALKFQRLEGAQDFVKILLNLGEPTPLPKKQPETGLNYA